MNRALAERRFSRRGLLALSIGSIAATLSGPVFAATAEAYVTSIGNGVLAAARNSSVGQFRSLLRANADIPRIAIYSLGPYRKNLPKNLQAEYFKLVENYISKIFVSHAKSLAGQKLTVVSAKDTGDSTMVRSQIVFGGGRTVPVTWRLIKRGGGFRVFDVNVDGVWLASTQKTNFTSVLKKNGGEITALLDYLRK